MNSEKCVNVHFNSGTKLFYAKILTLKLERSHLSKASQLRSMPTTFKIKVFHLVTNIQWIKQLLRITFVFFGKGSWHTLFLWPCPFICYTKEIEKL